MASAEVLPFGEVGTPEPPEPPFVRQPFVIITGLGEDQGLEAWPRPDLSLVPTLPDSEDPIAAPRHLRLVEVPAVDEQLPLRQRRITAERTAQLLIDNEVLQVRGDKEQSEAQVATEEQAPEIELPATVKASLPEAGIRPAAGGIGRKAQTANTMHGGRRRGPRRGSISLRSHERPCSECKQTRPHEINQRACAACTVGAAGHGRKASHGSEERTRQATERASSMHARLFPLLVGVGERRPYSNVQ